MTIFERDALTTRLFTTAPSARRIGKSVPRGGCEESGLPTSQIGVPVSSVQKVVCAAHPNAAPPETTGDITGSNSSNLTLDNNGPHCIRPCDERGKATWRRNRDDPALTPGLPRPGELILRATQKASKPMICLNRREKSWVLACNIAERLPPGGRMRMGGGRAWVSIAGLFFATFPELGP